MSRRSRSERRAAQQERAIASGDITALQRMVANDVAGAPSAVRRALASPPADSRELDALTVGLAQKLRHAGSPAKALEVSAAGRRRTAELRMEEAAAAFASGDDATAAAIAAEDEAVRRAMGPLLAAVRGEVPEASEAGPALRPLHAVARAVAHARRGEHAEARAVVHHIPLAKRPAVLGDEIAAAAELAQPERAAHGLAVLHGSPRLFDHPALGELAVAELALDERVYAELSQAQRKAPVIARRAVRMVLLAGATRAQVVEIVRLCGPEVFEDRGPAALYHGFSLLRVDPAAALRSFDRSIQLGGDLIEALRGKLIALDMATHRHPEGSPARLHAARDAAASADRLVHALERDPRGGPFAAAAGALAAERWLEAHEPRHARSSIQRARSRASGALVDRLDLLDADATAYTSKREGERLVDAVLARSPGNVEAWKLKVELALAQDDIDRIPQILDDAGAATGDPHFAATARDIRGRRGTLVPFEGLVPGKTSAGVLARELARATSEAIDAYPLAAAHREALAPPARLAFDAAAVAIAGERIESEELVLGRLREVVEAWRSAPHDLALLAAVAAYAGVAPLLAEALTEARDLDDAALRAVVEAFTVAGEPDAVELLLPRLASSLDRGARKRLRAAARGAWGDIPGVPDPEQVVQEIDLVLAPEFSIADYLEGGAEEDDPAELLDMLGGTMEFAERLDALPPEVFASIRDRVVPILAGPPSVASAKKVMAILAEIGVGASQSQKGGRR